MTFDLFTDAPEVNGELKSLAPGAKLLRGLATPATAAFLSTIKRVTERVSFRIMTTRGGHRMSVRITAYSRARG